MRKLKILYVTDLGGHDGVGPTYSVPAQVQAQSKLDDVYWLNVNANSRPDWEEVEAYHTSKGQPFSWDLIPQEFQKPDLAVFEDFYIFGDCKTAAMMRKRGIPYVIVPRGALTRDAQKQKRLKKILGNLAFFYRYTRKALGIQFLAKDELEKSSPYWNKNRFVIPNGVYPREQTKEWRASQELIFSFVGRIRLHAKGIDLLIPALASIREKLVENRCKVYLYGNHHATSEEDTRNLITQYHMEDVVFMGDAVYGEAKEKVFLNSDVFILPSRFEGMPMGLLEALSYGLPAVVTMGTNMGEDVMEYQAGWVAEETTVEAIADAFSRCIDQKERLPEYSENAIKLSQKYNWDSLAVRAHEIYEKLLSQQ